MGFYGLQELDENVFLSWGRFPEESLILKILQKDCFIWRKVPNLEIPRLPGPVSQVRIPQKLPFAFFRLPLALSLALPLALQFNKNCLRNSLDLLEYCL